MIRQFMLIGQVLSIILATVTLFTTIFFKKNQKRIDEDGAIFHENIDNILQKAKDYEIKQREVRKYI